MDKKAIVSLLNEDLGREYHHLQFYLHASIVVTGFHREEFSEFFLTQAKSEMEHIRQFGNLILGLEGKPVNRSECVFCINKPNPKVLLDMAIEMEEEVVKNYTIRINDNVLDLRKNDLTSATIVEIFLENQILDSWTDMQNMKQMLERI